MAGEITKGAAWMVLFRLFDRSVGLLSTALLARILLPADYGLVAMAMSVIAVLELATAFSFEMALIQKPQPSPQHYDTAWTLNILIATGGAAMTAALSVPAAAFYGDPRLAPVMLAICVGWFLSGFENVGVVDFRRRMDFNAEFRFLAAKRMVAFVVVMVAALTLRSYWALVIGMIAHRVAGLVLSYAVQPLRPRPSLQCARELFSFSGWLLINNIATVALSRAPHYLVGRLFGAQALGAYSVGLEISQLPHTELVAPINRAMFPGYSRIAGDALALRRTWIDANALIAMISLPVAAGIAILAAPFVRLLLGPNWGDAVPIIQVLTFGSLVTALASNTFSAWFALARSYLPTIILFIRLTTLLVAGYVIVVIYEQGLIGVAEAELVAACCGFFATLPFMFSTLKVSPRMYLVSLWRPTVATAAMSLVVLEASTWSDGGDSLAFAASQVLVGSATGAISYIGAVWLLWRLSGRPRTVEAVLIDKLQSMLNKARHKAG
jgi:lipopolysaccharide exporter